MNESPSEIYERETGKRIGTETLTGGLLTIRDFGTRDYISFLESNFRRIPWKETETDSFEALASLAAEIRELIYGDFDEAHREGMIGSPSEVLANALDWIRRRSWKKYPEEKPENAKEYIVTVIEENDGVPYPSSQHDFYLDGHWFEWRDLVIAFQPLPEPYKEGE